MVVDPVDERRLSYVKTIEPLLSPVDGLVTSSCSSGEFCAAWSAGTWTPISHAADGKNVAIIFGDAIKGSGSERMTAEQLRRYWGGSRLPDALGGFHAAATYSPQKGVVIGADLLGIFPIYYYASEDVILVGSSPELFRYHPCFEMKLNPVGFVGIFLTKGMFDGQTLLCGVRRLAPGHLLMWRPGERAEEVLQFEPQVSTKYFGLKLSEQVEVLGQALDEAISRHVPKGEKYGLMLSGGLDSRVLGGYLRRKDLDVVALTEGLPTDNEMRCAIPVANALGFKHVPFNVGYDNYAHYADLSATWQHLCEGFTSMMFWGFHPHLRKTATRVVTGYFATEILGDLFNSAIPKPGKPASFQTFFRFLNRSSFKPEILRKLLKEEHFDDLVSETLRKVRKTYESYSGLEFQRVWRYGLHHYMRFHVGSVVWPLSFGAWPILPFADQKVLETVGGMPIGALQDRHAERELLRKKFPKLARLPLNGITYDTTPLMPTPRQKGLQQIYGDGGIWKLEGARNLRIIMLVKLRGDRRYYSRISHFDSPGWQTVRKTAEPYLKLTSQFLDEDTVQELMPPPTAGYAHVRRTMKRTGMTETTGLKTLLGFALWLQKHPLAQSRLPPLHCGRFLNRIHGLTA